MCLLSFKELEERLESFKKSPEAELAMKLDEDQAHFFEMSFNREDLSDELKGDLLDQALWFHLKESEKLLNLLVNKYPFRIKRSAVYELAKEANETQRLSREERKEHIRAQLEINQEAEFENSKRI